MYCSTKTLTDTYSKQYEAAEKYVFTRLMGFKYILAEDKVEKKYVLSRRILDIYILIHLPPRILRTLMVCGCDRKEMVTAANKRRFDS